MDAFLLVIGHIPDRYQIQLTELGITRDIHGAGLLSEMYLDPNDRKDMVDELIETHPDKERRTEEQQDNLRASIGVHLEKDCKGSIQSDTGQGLEGH